MKRPVLLGFVFVVAGVACIFPFIRALVLENMVVMLGVYLIYRGYLCLTSPIVYKNRCKSEKHSHGGIAIDDCNTDCNKKN